MQTRGGSNSQDDDLKVESVSLATLLTMSWKFRWTLVTVTLAVLMIGFLGSLYFASYKSEGFFQFGGPIPIPLLENEGGRAAHDTKHPPGISLPHYKGYAAAYASVDRFAKFIQDNKLESTEGVGELSKILVSSDSFSKLLEPVYALDRQDLKHLFEPLKGTGNNNIIGFRIVVAGASPARAQQMVELLGWYVIDTIAYVAHFYAVQNRYDAIKKNIIVYDNVILAKLEQVAEYRRRAESLKQIVRRYPEAAGANARQVVSVTDDTARYLSPVTLLATTEVEESEAHEAILRARREKVKAAIFLDYYARVRELLNETRSGQAVVSRLETIKDSVFKGKNLDNDVIKEVHNKITIENQSAANVYLKNSRFIAGPTLPGRPTPRPIIAASASLLLGFIFALLVVFTKQFWINNRAAIRGK